MNIFHRRNLPHLHPPEGTFFVTYRLAGTFPAEVIKKLRAEYLSPNTRHPELKPGTPHEAEDIKRKRFFAKYDAFLDRAEVGPQYLSIPEIAEINKQALHYYDQHEYHLICYCIMSNHIHVVFALHEQSRPLSKIMQSIKRYTARESNKVLQREGSFWKDESFDRLVRNPGELGRIVNYVLMNPVKAGIVKHWQEWKYSYVNSQYL
jgi:putative transposase